MSNSIYSMLGLCMKSGNLLSGEFQCEKAVKARKAKLVIIAKDASYNTKKLFKDKCSYRKIPFYEFGTKEELGRAIGKSPRSSLAVMDENFSAQLIKMFDSCKL
ncbi:MAG: 50S ribosomal protein L7ae [Epulopiscium sp.]|jgi:ribosomal protein L7Ae-like RNA K-turn-binding protein|nr:50S ribosomal protein L7ae [Candidatus Epulonipiscium sp.]HOQ16497.1 ribosomal L7Ae/L30e/S12e/Gadd45 family protein [Defluviitaleaceae bacterium]HPT75273.1 ribosomal L7Ae/L30e/S12e/Gadd45 family protein [Defluviitaleaceae bacterium]